MRLNVFGREMEVLRREGQWLAYHLGNEGKKRLAADLTIPAGIDESELLTYIADVCHEWATPAQDRVFVISREEKPKDSHE